MYIGNIYTADHDNNVIRKVTVSTGIITTIAGTGNSGYSGDGGAATSATLGGPFGIAVDSSGNVYYVAQDSNAGAIRKIASTNIKSAVAGGYGWGYSGTDIDATSAYLCNPVDVAVDLSNGNIYLTEHNCHLARKIDVSTGVMSTISGTDLYYPRGIAVDTSSNVYISDCYHHRIRKYTASTGAVTTIAGTGSNSYSGDNEDATSSTFSYPVGVTVDSSGKIYFFYSNKIELFFFLQLRQCVRRR